MASVSIGVRKAIVFAVVMLPLAGLIASMFVNPPVDPYERIAHITGENALRLLVLTLLITPLKQAFGWRWIGAYRRTLGVASFTYAVAHVAAYQALEANFELAYMFEDIAERRYILFGALAFLMMLPLGLSSNNWSVRRLGGKLWKRIHLMVFPLSLFAVAHLYLQTRGDKTEPLVYLAVLLALFAWRIVAAVRKRRRAGAEPTAG